MAEFQNPQQEPGTERRLLLVFALTFLGADTAKFTLPIYVQYFYGRNGANWGAIMAASTLFTVPVLAFFLLVQRRLRSGLVAGAVKG